MDESSTTTDDLFYMPVNKYEEILKKSCEKLERRIELALAEKQQPTIMKVDEDCPHTFPQPFLTHPGWHSRNADVAAEVGNSSLDSIPTVSDYGSLPRPRHLSRRVPTCSPSAYLKQLTTMRRQIVESSREGSRTNS